MKPYESYKKTNIPWVEEIPGHWEFKRITHLFTENKDINADVQETNALQFKFGELIQKKKFELDDELKTISKYTIIKPFDIMINGLNLNYDFVTQRVGLVKQTGVITSAYISIRPREHIKAEYFALLLKSLDAKKVFNGMGSGIRLTLDYSELKKIQLPVPSSIEQDQIVRFFDWKLNQLNKLIKAKKKQIALLNEQKQAIINKAITKGLDDTVPMKDSGIYWLGDIPTNWSLNRLKRFCKVNASISQLASNYSDEDMVVFLPMENVSAQGEIDCSILRKFKEVRSGYSSFAKNDVVVAKITPCFENGKGACLDKLETEIGYGTTEFITLRAYESLLPKYLYYITRTSYFRLLGAEVMTGSAGQKRVPTDFISNFIIGIPQETDEQIMIVDYIDKKTLMINKALSDLSKELDYIAEYKVSLIFSVVTGKIDVRDMIVPDFNIEDETEPFNDEIEVEVEE